MELEPNDLLLFARVVEEGSFSKAAQRLGAPVSTVSRRISALEKQLGERLILRTTRKLTVTELGLALLEHARAVVVGVEAAVELADHRQVQPSGQLRITAPSDISVLAPFFAEFLASYPAITLEIEASMRVVDLLSENFDLALRLGRRLSDDATLVARHIVDLHGGLYAAPAYLRKHGVPKDPDALQSHQALHGRLPRTGEPLPWILQRGKQRWEGVPPARAIVHTPSLLIQLATHGAGITIAEQRAVEPYIKTGQLVRVLPDWEFPVMPMWAVFVGRKLMSAKTRVFVDALAAKFSSP